MDIFKFVSQKIGQGRGVVLATVVKTKGSTPAEVGKKMAVADDGSNAGTVGGGILEAKIIEAARDVLKEKKPKLLHFRLDDRSASEAGMLCGGEQEVFLDSITLSHHLLILGAGHLGLALARVAEAINFPYSVVDDRLEFVSPQRFTAARQIIQADFFGSWDNFPVDGDTFLVIVTRGHQFDQVCLEKALKTSARYIGMVGSRKKVQKIFSALEKKGGYPGKDPRVYAPLGLEVGDSSPEEIAISIMAEILAVKSGGFGGHMRDAVPRKR